MCHWLLAALPDQSWSGQDLPLVVVLSPLLKTQDAMCVFVTPFLGLLAVSIGVCETSLAGATAWTMGHLCSPH